MSFTSDSLSSPHLFPQIHLFFILLLLFPTIHSHSIQFLLSLTQNNFFYSYLPFPTSFFPPKTYPTFLTSPIFTPPINTMSTTFHPFNLSYTFHFLFISFNTPPTQITPSFLLPLTSIHYHFLTSHTYLPYLHSNPPLLNNSNISLLSYLILFLLPTSPTQYNLF